MHPDAVIAIAASRDSRGADARRSSAARSAGCPGSGRASTSASSSGQLARENPAARGRRAGRATASSPGATTSKACYETTLRIIQKAARLPGGEADRKEPASAAAVAAARRRPASAAVAARADAGDPRQLSKGVRKVGHFDDAPEVLEFVNAARAAELAALGTSCPDHFLRTKIRPLVAAFRSRHARCRATSPRASTAPLEAYRERLRRPTTSAASTPTRPAMRDPNPVIYLVPGVGMLAFAQATRRRRASPRSSTSTRST